jgi:hypothetical protein
MKNLQGFYRGIIVQNNDPQKLGRVKVFIPHIHMAMLDIEKDDYDKEFYFGEFGTNYQKKDNNLVDLTKYIEKSKLKLPWAEVSLPITGGGYSSFNSGSNRATISDSPNFANQIADEDGSTGAPDGAEVKANPPTDRFSSSSDNPNPMGSAYTTQSFYNAPKGMFGVPQVNTKVWLFFLDANPNTPVVFGYSPSASTYNQIYDDTNYPSGYENNDPTKDANPENVKRRNMMAINQKGGSISFNGTDNEESLSIAHDGGSYTQFTNSGRQSLSMVQSSELVKGPSYTTIDDRHSFHCGDESDVSVQGDIKIQVGSANYAAAQRWKDAALNIHAVKSLPEIQHSGGDSLYSSPLAKKGADNGPCPACSQGKSRKTLTGGNGDEKNSKKIDEGQTSFLDSLKSNFLSFLGQKSKLEIEDAKEEQFPKTKDCKVCGGSGKSPSSMGGNFPKETRKEEIGNLYLNSAQEFFEAENELGNGGSITMNVTKDVFLSIGCASNDLDSIRVNPQGSAHDIGIKLDGGKGLYPSQVVGSVVEKVHVDKFPGGQFTIDAQNGINLLGGSGGIDFSSTGSMSIHGTIAEITGEQVNISSKSGMNIATEDVLSIKSPNIAIQADNQVFVKPNLAVEGNIVCSGGIMSQGELFVQHITAPMSLQETEFQSELYGRAYGEKPMIMGFIRLNEAIDCKIKVSGLGLTAGGTPVTGEDLDCTVTINATVPIYTTDSGQKAEDGSIYVYPHQHLFRNLPLTLTTTYEAMRASASGIDGGSPIASKKIENGLTCPEVKGTTKDSTVGLQNQLGSKKFTPLEV